MIVPRGDQDRVLFHVPVSLFAIRRALMVAAKVRWSVFAGRLVR
jgi:hypothetical protein